ncbi:PCRF domain-containing protein, partial [Thermoproteota archaeon]
MLNKLRDIEEKFLEIERKISDPEIIAKQSVYQELTKKHAELSPCVQTFREFKKIEQEIKDTSDLLKDPDMKQIAEEELSVLKNRREALKEELQFQLIPKDPNDTKNAIVEIRSGTGGEEAALFANALFRMYSKYAELKGWKIEILSENLTGLGGIKEVVFVVSGTGAFS